jgi:hypothetical protein
VTLPTARTGNQVLAVRLRAYPSGEGELTLGDPEVVIWSAIRHLAARSVAIEIARRRHGVANRTDQREVAHNLQLYIQQAFEFYESASGAKSSTAPLLYYYSFLHLAKALCELRRPGFHKQAECYKHGLVWKPSPGVLVDPKSAWLSFNNRGVWHVLWESVMRVPIPTPSVPKLTIKDLFSYCPEIAVEVKRSLGTEVKLVELVDAWTMKDTTTLEAWVKLSVVDRQLVDLGWSVTDLIAQIANPRTAYIEVLPNKAGLRTFESVVPKVLGQDESPEFGLGDDVLGLNIFACLWGGGKVAYTLPVQSWLPLRVPQLVAYYTLLFWLGSIVRYDPRSLAALMDSEHWTLIDGFMCQSRLWLLELFRWAFYQSETPVYSSR